MRGRRLAGILFLGFGAVCATPSFATPNLADARQFILDGVVRTSRILKDHKAPREIVSERLRREFRYGFDVPTIAGFVIGPAGRTLTGDQKRRYLNAFEELIVQTYTNRVFAIGPLIKDDISDIIRVSGGTPVGKDQMLVHSEVNRKGAKWVKIDWRLRERGNRLAILDIIILGISQLELYRSEFSSVMRRSGRGVEGLIDALQKKAAQLKNGG